jgi:transposase
MFLSRCLPFLGLDDFAFKKGHTYGTLICDLKSHLPIALLPDRLAESVTEWLVDQPHIQVVSRDGFNPFRQGITEASPSILQVYDRWHFIRNAKKQLDNCLAPLVPAKITWEEPVKKPLQVPLTQVQKQAKKNQEKKWALIKQIKEEHLAGKNISRLAREYRLDRTTIRTYIHMTEPPSFQRIRKKASDPYREKIQQLESAGCTVKEIFRLLRLEDYRGTLSQIRTLVETIRKNRRNGLSNKTVTQILRPTLAAFLWKGADKLEEKQQRLLHECLQRYPAVAALYKNIHSYRLAIENRDYPAFLTWLKEQLLSKKNPFYYYAFRLRSDLQAVKNAFHLSYSNGLLEGHINRLKTIKRMLYGRASLPLLQKRILYYP